MKRYESMVQSVLLAVLFLLLVGPTAQSQQVTPSPDDMRRFQENMSREVERYYNLLARSGQGGGPRGAPAPEQERTEALRQNEAALIRILATQQALQYYQAQQRQPRAAAWWTDRALVERLGLTADQKAKIERAFENHRQRIMSSTELLEKEEAQLAKLLAAESLDRNAVLSQIDRVVQARGEVERANSAMTLEMRESLTRAQWTQLHPERVRVGANILAANVITQIAPVYPESARQAGIEGVVTLEAEISREGTVENVRVISGPPQLTQAAVDAVKQWRYQPTLLNGAVVPVVGNITVNFPFSYSSGGRGGRGTPPTAPGQGAPGQRSRGGRGPQ